MSTNDKIMLPAEAAQKIKHWKNQGKKTVFSNGCFDILHAGHVDYLEKARNIGDHLVVGLNTDASVSKLKGPQRPIVDQNSRARILAALQCIDMVVLFDEETPLELIMTLNPDVLVKGKDYEVSNIVGADYVLQNGGKVETIELTAGLSTTNVIDKIKNIT
ncbi:MAG: D-glycero-beta-D-manno-heptose 1-phosphate adenylyltransferase [Cyclobacteriaceae bacterium]|nr:D-glycero-beta-D-manno-heptose 1-phosphate adenylyltransferase [Cyclobacteriaceae bacterium]